MYSSSAVFEDSFLPFYPKLKGKNWILNTEVNVASRVK